MATNNTIGLLRTAAGAGVGLPTTGSSGSSLSLLLRVSLMAMGVVLWLAGRRSRTVPAP